jgi:hypothetical protein
MTIEIEKLNGELLKAVNERNAAWFQLEEAGIPINAVTEEGMKDSNISDDPSILAEIIGFLPTLAGKVDLDLSLDAQKENPIAHNIRYRFIENSESNFIGYQRLMLADQVLEEAEKTLRSKLERLEKDTFDIGSHKYGYRPSNLSFTGSESELIGRRTKAFKKLHKNYEHICHQAKMVSETAVDLKRNFSDHI